jgi:hypothetical protein
MLISIINHPFWGIPHKKATHKNTTNPPESHRFQALSAQLGCAERHLFLEKCHGQEKLLEIQGKPIDKNGKTHGNGAKMM